MKKSRIRYDSKGNFLFKLSFLIFRIIFKFICLYLFILSILTSPILFFLCNELVDAIFIDNRKKYIYDISHFKLFK